jgi:hypothetical protein
MSLRRAVCIPVSCAIYSMVFNPSSPPSPGLNRRADCRTRPTSRVFALLPLPYLAQSGYKAGRAFVVAVLSAVRAKGRIGLERIAPRGLPQGIPRRLGSCAAPSFPLCGWWGGSVRGNTAAGACARWSASCAGGIARLDIRAVILALVAVSSVFWGSVVVS